MQNSRKIQIPSGIPYVIMKLYVEFRISSEIPYVIMKLYVEFH